MDILTYNLKGKSVNSNAYYEKLKAVSNRIKNLLFDYGKIQIEEFMIYVVKNNIEDLRTILSLILHRDIFELGLGIFVGKGSDHVFP